MRTYYSENRIHMISVFELWEGAVKIGRPSGVQNLSFAYIIFIVFLSVSLAPLQLSIVRGGAM